MVGVVFSGVVAMVAVVTSPSVVLDVVWCSAVVVVVVGVVVVCSCSCSVVQCN